MISKRRIYSFLIEPANYTLDLLKNVYDPRGIDYGFLYGKSKASRANSRVVGGFRSVYSILDAHNCLIINGYSCYGCLLVILINILFYKKPMALESDTELQIPTNKIKRLLKWIWLSFLFTRKYCYGFAGGNFGHKELFRHYGMTEERIFLMPMMVDNDKFKRELPGSSHKPFHFGYLGRLVAHKQVDKIIQALPEGCELHIVGEGEDRLKLEAIANGKNVIFHGGVFGDEKIKLLHSIDCLVLYSAYEPWGLVVNEALASGVPVIVSDRVGAKKDLIEGELPTGFVARWDDLVDLRSKMLEMASNQATWSIMSRNAVKRMKSWDYTHYGINLDSWINIVCK